MKYCNVCGEQKTFDDFYKDGRLRNGISNKCKSCTNTYNRKWHLRNPDKHNEYQKKWNKENRLHITERQREKRKLNPDMARTHTLRQYGITLDQYRSMEMLQNSKCAICDAFDKKLFVDHCHKTGR